jgi:hypothetical protein
MLNPVPPSTGERRVLSDKYKQYKGIAEKLLKKWQVIEASEICLKVNVRDHGLSPGPDAQVDLYVLES